MLVAVALSCLVGEAAAEPAAILSNKRKDERVQEIRTLRKGGETVPTIIERTGFSKASFGDHQALAGTWGQRAFTMPRSWRNQRPIGRIAAINLLRELSLGCC